MENMVEPIKVVLLSELSDDRIMEHLPIIEEFDKLHDNKASALVVRHNPPRFDQDGTAIGQLEIVKEIADTLDVLVDHLRTQYKYVTLHTVPEPALGGVRFMSEDVHQAIKSAGGIK